MGGTPGEASHPAPLRWVRVPHLTGIGSRLGSRLRCAWRAWRRHPIFQLWSLLANLMSTYAELLTLESWIATPDVRRSEIAQAVAKDHGLELETLAPFQRADLPLASYKGLDGLFRFVLVPGGSFSAGLSDAEVSHLEALAKPHRDDANFQLAWGNLFDNPSPMRPVRPVTVGPVLFAQNTMGDFALDDWRTEMGEALVGEGVDVSTLHEDIEVAFAARGFRLPTENEWEWCARGGRQGEVTFKGNVVPDEGYYRTISRELDRSEERDPDRHCRRANDFGLLGFGVHAELCSDAYRERPDSQFLTTKTWADRVIRGGAGATYKWQNPGEWQALLTAHRMRARGLLYAIGIRPVRTV